MEFVSQVEALKQLQSLRQADRHSVLIEGVAGCGKTYLAKQYANMVGIEDFQIVEPNVQSIRDAIDTCMVMDNKVVLCIENLDTGVPAASYTLLKFLEEPTSNVWVVVTCRNINKVPDTIISRSAVVNVSPPLVKDIELFSQTKHASRYPIVSKRSVWGCVRTFGDADTVLRMTDSQLDYFDSLRGFFMNLQPVSTMMWTIVHYTDNTETPVELVIRFLSYINNDPYIQKCAIQCLKDMTQSNIAQHICIAKFCFDTKYGKGSQV